MSDTWAKRKSRRAARRRAVVLASRLVAFVALALCTLSIASYLLFPVEQVSVEGNQRLPEEEILQNIPEHASLPTVSARRLHGQVESNPWVEGVSVNKSWRSDTVTVQVEERTPSLNVRLAGGESIVVAEDGTRLPGLGGESLPEVELDADRLDEVQSIQRTLDEGGVEVASVNSVDARGIVLSVVRPEGPNAQAIVSDDVGIGQARVLEDLLGERPEARYFDLRTPERVVASEQPPGDSSGSDDSGSS